MTFQTGSKGEFPAIIKSPMIGDRYTTEYLLENSVSIIPRLGVY